MAFYCFPSFTTLYNKKLNTPYFKAKDNVLYYPVYSPISYLFNVVYTWKWHLISSSSCFHIAVHSNQC